MIRKVNMNDLALIELSNTGSTDAPGEVLAQLERAGYLTLRGGAKLTASGRTRAKALTPIAGNLRAMGARANAGRCAHNRRRHVTPVTGGDPNATQFDQWHTLSRTLNTRPIMYGGAITNPEFTTTPTPAPTATTSPQIGFAAGGRWFPLAITPARIEAGRIGGIDLARPQTIFNGSGPKRLMLAVQAVYLAAGGQDDEEGVAVAGTRVSPEQFGRMMADPKTFEAAGRALILAAIEYAKQRA
ncbi:MAG: hypothetical protein K8U57_12650 [Planctomycetes bacterium]|nr:hypothetical protein [Planctomycetota bacterium]